MLRQALQDSNVGIDHVGEVEGPSGTAVILVQPSGGSITNVCVAFALTTISARTCVCCTVSCGHDGLCV